MQQSKLIFANQIRSRDNWTCQQCGSVEYPQAHHIAPVKDYPLFSYLINNGITLCVHCHADAHPEMPRNLFIANVIKAEKEGCISAGKLAKELGVHPRTIVTRARKLDILKPMQKWIFTEEEADSLRTQSYKRRIPPRIICEGIIMTRTPIRITEKQNDLYIHLSKREGLPADELIRRALDHYIETKFASLSYMYYIKLYKENNHANND